MNGNSQINRFIISIPFGEGFNIPMNLVDIAQKAPSWSQTTDAFFRHLMQEKPRNNIDPDVLRSSSTRLITQIESLHTLQSRLEDANTHLTRDRIIAALLIVSVPISMLICLICVTNPEMAIILSLIAFLVSSAASAGYSYTRSLQTLPSTGGGGVFFPATEIYERSNRLQSGIEQEQQNIAETMSLLEEELKHRIRYLSIQSQKQWNPQITEAIQQEQEQSQQPTLLPTIRIAQSTRASAMHELELFATFYNDVMSHFKNAVSQSENDKCYQRPAPSAPLCTNTCIISNV